MAELTREIKQVQELADRFASHFAQYSRPAYNETEVRVEFVNPFFQVLGWDVLNERGLPQHLREVKHETNIVVEEEGQGRKKRPDYSFRNGTEICFFLETKKPAVDILSAQEPADSRIVPTTQLFDVNVGLVSGENDFFVIDQDRVKKFGIEAYVEPIVSKADQVRGICFSMDNLSELIEKKRRVFLFNPDDKPFGELSTEEQNYIRWGEELGFNLNYKCRIRKRWYVVPKAWRPNAFLIRQANLYPKIIINNANTVVTDTLHKVRFREQVNDKAVAAAFLNTYTFALAETSGRSYGGGVLTFEPGEVRKLRIPMVGSDELDLIEIDKQQRDGDIEKILENTDEILLRKGLGLSNSEISILHSIWDKLRNRRLGRKKHRRTVKS